MRCSIHERHLDRVGMETLYDKRPVMLNAHGVANAVYDSFGKLVQALP